MAKHLLAKRGVWSTISLLSGCKTLGSEARASGEDLQSENEDPQAGTRPVCMDPVRASIYSIFVQFSEQQDKIREAVDLIEMEEITEAEAADIEEIRTKGLDGFERELWRLVGFDPDNLDDREILIMLRLVDEIFGSIGPCGPYR